MKFVVSGHVRPSGIAPDGTSVSLRTLQAGDFLGQTALTREPVLTDSVALDEVTVLEIDRDDVEALVRDRPTLVQDIGRAIEDRRTELHRVLAAIQQD